MEVQQGLGGAIVKSHADDELQGLGVQQVLWNELLLFDTFTFQDEGAGFLEPTEGLEKPTGVLTLPGQSFDGLDDLIMQIAEGGVGGCSDREKTELEQQARHLGVPSTVGTIPRPLEPKHAAGESARHCLSPAYTKKGVQPRAASHPMEAPPALGGPGLLQAWFCIPASQITEKGLL